MLVVVERGVVLDCFVLVSDEELRVLGRAVGLHLRFKVLNPLNDLVNVPILHARRVHVRLLEFSFLLIRLVKFDLQASQVALDTLDAVVRVLVHLHAEHPRFFLAGQFAPEELDKVVRLEPVFDFL